MAARRQLFTDSVGKNSAAGKARGCGNSLLPGAFLYNLRTMRGTGQSSSSRRGASTSADRMCDEAGARITNRRLSRQIAVYAGGRDVRKTYNKVAAATAAADRVAYWCLSSTNEFVHAAIETRTPHRGARAGPRGARAGQRGARAGQRGARSGQRGARAGPKRCPCRPKRRPRWPAQPGISSRGASRLDRSLTRRPV